jgi:hypothetical protein
MRSCVLTKVKFSFGHFVTDPHFHPDAAVELLISSEMCIEPDHPLHMMGADGVAVRFCLERLLAERLAGRLVIWDQELDAARAMPLQRRTIGIVAPVLVETVWPVRPTIETVTMFVALMCVEAVAAANDPTARIEEIRMFETERTAGVVRTEELDDFLAAARSVFLDA